MTMGRLWRDLHLDYFCILGYAPGDSRYNMIEHCWAPVTTWLTGLQLSDTIPGEDKNPEAQSKLSEEDRARKNATVLDNAIRDVHKCLDGKMYDSFKVTAVAMDSSSTHHYSDEAKVEELSDASVKKIKADIVLTELAAEYKFLASHSVQRTYQLEFVKCQDSQCHHCSNHPVRAKKLLTFLREFGGGHGFTPVPSDKVPGHFFTWQEMASKAVTGKLKIPALDEGVHSPINGERVCQAGCKKVFVSAADRDRHNRLMHKL
ncbi:uncharacterized protein LOC119725325 [Patiria miniata]|uniref:C2H2-type domain-containing protein n=1 Tax=Patiria miniata TaxID=46514 RepID=A0A913ZNF5_PATMI|nr:uncharacterized protein LOC119725325 [Patiria miniata]